MEALVQGFLLDRKASNATAKTLDWHTRSIKKFQDFLLDNTLPTDPEKWNRTTLRLFIVWLQETPSRYSGQLLSGTSVRTFCNSVWAFLHWLYKEGLMSTNIASEVNKPKLPKVQKIAFTDAELKALIEAAKRTLNAHRDLAIMYLLLDGGFRAAEVCNLNVGDVHLNQDQQLVVIRGGKGQKDRVVPISVKAALAVTKYLTRVRGNCTNRDDVLFMNKRGGKMTPNGLDQLVNRISSAAGVENAYPHKFRHTFALLYLRNGGDPLTLQRILGHETLDMVNRYVKMVTDDLSRVHATASPLMNLK